MCMCVCMCKNIAIIYKVVFLFFQGLSVDKEGLSKLKNALKDLSKAGICKY